MSGNHQDIVAPDVPESQATDLAAKAVTWLQGQGIIAKNPSPCAMDPDATAYAPGPRWQPAAEDHARFLNLAVNGVELVTSRTIFDTGGNGIELTCVSCSKAFEPGDGYIQAIDAWAAGDDDAVYACDHCGHETRLVDWTGPYACGVGCLGLIFWNWPPLRPQFVLSLGQTLGARVTVVRGRV